MKKTPRTDLVVAQIKSQPLLKTLEAKTSGASYGEQWQAGTKALWAALLTMAFHAKDLEIELNAAKGSKQ